jgi:hypothetical protein
MRPSRRSVPGVALLVLVASTTALIPAGGGGAAVGATPDELPAVQKIRAFGTSEYGVRRPSGLAWSPRRDALVVTSGVAGGTKTTWLSPDGSVIGRARATGRPSGPRLAAGPDTASSTALAGSDLRGLSARPDSDLRYTYDATEQDLLGLDPSGRVVERRDAEALGLVDVQGLAFGPSADATDDPTTQSLYIADAGAGPVLGEIVEATLDPVPVSALSAVSGTQVRVVQTSAFNPPSPDPSGLAYLPGADRLFIADGEVDEMSIFRGSNLFSITRAGAVVTTGVSQPWSDEPVGVGYNPANNHLFVSDDDQKEVFEIVAGGDGRFGTPDDTVTHFDTRAQGNSDPEGLDYDPATNSIWLVDGVNTQVFRVRAGGDSRFGTGDDVWSNFDVGGYGARDPEGLGFDPVRDTIVIVDDGSDTIYELDRSGALLNTISTSSAGMVAAAGLAVAPGSSDASRRNYYVVARGQDNDSHPTENDGRLHEIAADLPPVGTTNQAPLVSAGSDATVTLPAAAALDGTVSDDGRPNPPGSVSTTWSKVSGPGTVTFGSPAAPDTTATFSAAGSYVLRLSAFDGAATTVDDVTVLVMPEGSPSAVQVRVAAGPDDAEQAVSGSMALTSSDLELGADGSTAQLVGTRFAGVAVPAGASITNAYVQFRVDEVSTGASSLTIRAEAADSAATYQQVSGSMAARAVTAASVAWSPPAWPTVGAAGVDQRTPNIAALVQAVVNRPGWASGNALALRFSGTGRRTAEAYEGGSAFAALLHIEYSTGGGGPVNQAPVVDAGGDATVTLPASVSLDGTISDDGRPDPPGSVSSTWSRVSGPGTVTFGNAGSVDTTASFSGPGSYLLRLSADDSELSAADELTVTVRDAGGPGQPGQAEVRVAAGPDDAEQGVVSGNMGLTSNDLELGADGNTLQLVGTRFAGVAVPAGARITNAYVQFRVDEVSTGATSLTIRAEAADSAATYQAANGSMAARAVTAASVAWSPPAWPTAGAAGADQRTPDIAALVQAVVDRPGWASGNALALRFSGTGRRIAEAYEGGAGLAPLLHIEYTTG